MHGFETVIGLEVHIQLNTRSKAFGPDLNAFGGAANENIHFTSLGLPGTLPVLNKVHVQSAIKLGLALGCTIHRQSVFDRKNYFYPDLPKGYQITQDHQPICTEGYFHFRSGQENKTVGIFQIHMEEDAGKLIHDMEEKDSLVDYNRAGTPLLEVVTKPDFRSGMEVADFIRAFQVLVRHLDISDGNMEEGSMRCDCNISVRERGTPHLGTRCEVKNLNSKRFARQAIAFEAQRQVALIQNGGKVSQESRLFDPATGKTFTMRKKEDALDYRYFPDPDLHSVDLSDEDIDRVRQSIGLLPSEIEQQLITHEGINAQTAEILASNKGLYDFYSQIKDAVDPSLAAAFTVNHVLRSQDHFSAINIKTWVDMLRLIEQERVSPSKAYETLLPAILDKNSENVVKLAAELNILLTENEGLEIEEAGKIIEANPDKVKAYRNGKKGLIGFFMGEAMKSTKSSLNPKKLREALLDILNNQN